MVCELDLKTEDLFFVFRCFASDFEAFLGVLFAAVFALSRLDLMMAL